MAQAICVPSADRAQFPGVMVGRSTSAELAYAELVGWLAGHPPSPIPVSAEAADLESRADHMRGVLGRLLIYLRVLLDDAAQNVPRNLDLRQIEALLADLASEVAGTLHDGAEALPGRR